MNAPYELHSSYSELPALESPLLVVMMTGWIDAGSAAANAMTHLVEVTGATTLLTFDSDEFIDYRARRPLMELRDGVSTRLVWATPEMMRGRDVNGRDVSQIDYYVAFAYWKVACIIEGVYARYVGGALGTRSDEEIAPFVTQVDAALRAADETLARLH